MADPNSDEAFWARARGSGLRHARWLLLGVALGGYGCSTGNSLGYVTPDEELHPAVGSVTVDGVPAKNARVILHRLDSATLSGRIPGDPKLIRPNPQGDCDENGQFQVYTYTPYDGAPVGEYLVTVSWTDPEARGRDGENYPELLPSRFQNPRESGLKATIVEGANVLDPIVIKTR